jgi:hypothetical protein
VFAFWDCGVSLLVKASLASNRGGKFGEDLEVLISKLTINMEEYDAGKLRKLRDDLLGLHRLNVVKINHSVMELVCAKRLILKGYDVELEYALSSVLVCDLFSTKGYGDLIVEIETGYIPPEHAMDPMEYTSARLASKIIRYSGYAGKFAIGVPPHYVLPLPYSLVIPPRRRTAQDIEWVKTLVDKYYQSPPVTLEEIANARIQEIQIIDVDHLAVLEMDPEAYMKRALHKGISFDKGESRLEQEVSQDPLQDNERLDFYMK